jgi:hypothetical protein
MWRCAREAIVATDARKLLLSKDIPALARFASPTRSCRGVLVPYFPKSERSSVEVLACPSASPRSVPAPTQTKSISASGLGDVFVGRFAHGGPMDELPSVRGIARAAFPG